MFEVRSLYFNPAGLAGTQKAEATLNLSPTIAKFEGPIYGGGPRFSSATQIAPIYGVFGSYPVTPSFGLGVGIYIAGGLSVKYENIDVAAECGIHVI